LPHILIQIPSYLYPDFFTLVMLCYIAWDVNPEVFRIGHFALRWYSGLIVIAFLTCYFLASEMIVREGDPKKIQENGTFYFLTGLIAGARLGHCFFYEPSFYMHQPLEILMVWKGGLSSHGAILGILFGMWIYARKVHIPWFWFIDKLAVVFTLAGVFIRIGNLLNSEALWCTYNSTMGIYFRPPGRRFSEASCPALRGHCLPRYISLALFTPC